MLLKQNVTQQQNHLNTKLDNVIQDFSIALIDTSVLKPHYKKYTLVCQFYLLESRKTKYDRR
jgi:hypothetical protein